MAAVESTQIEDENAFGFLIAYFAIEEDEYTLDRAEFVARAEAFNKIVKSHLLEQPLADHMVATDLGHAVYMEVAEDECSRDAIMWLTALRKKLAVAEFDTVAVLSHGGRWVTQRGEPLHGLLGHVGNAKVCTVSGPSEPLRRALYAETASRPDAEGNGGWGPGLYVDTEAVEALGRALKNAPTPLEVAGATFYRTGR